MKNITIYEKIREIEICIRTDQFYIQNCVRNGFFHSSIKLQHYSLSLKILAKIPWNQIIEKNICKLISRKFFQLMEKRKIHCHAIQFFRQINS